MNTYEKVVKAIETNKKNREEGNHNMIPFCFPRYRQYFDGWSKGDYIGLLSSTGNGKSKLLRYWMYSIVDFSIKNNYPVKILYFSLEDPEIPVAVKIMSHYLYIRHGISISSKDLNSKESPLHDKYLDLIKADYDFWKQFYNIVEIINDLTSPNQIAAKVREVYNNFGKNHHMFVMIDNQSNITADEEDGSEWEAIKLLSRNIIRLGFCKVGITTITVLQTDFESERNSFRTANKGGIASVEPNLSSVGDAKIVVRAMHYVFSIFSPDRFDIQTYPGSGGYRIDILRGRFRALLMLKSNESEVAGRFGLKFDGLHEIFEEMPLITDTTNLEKIYKNIIDEDTKRLARLQGKLL